MLLRHNLQRSEVLLLTKFVEVLVPTQYVLFMLLSFYGPNTDTLLGFDTLTGDAFFTWLMWMLSLIGVEAAGFAVTCWLQSQVQADTGTPLQLLAFVLRRNWRLLFTSVMTSMVFPLVLTMKHMGADFAFEFVWLGNSTAQFTTPVS